MNLTAIDIKALSTGHLQSAWKLTIEAQTWAIQNKEWGEAERLTDQLNAIRAELGSRDYVEAIIKID